VSRGTALLETLVVGFAVVLLVAQALVTLGRLERAAEDVSEAARLAATWTARRGSPDEAARRVAELLPEARVRVESAGDALTVVVDLDVPLAGPGRSPLVRTVTGRATVRLSRYRSGR